jgi:hypothetical protein
MFSWAKQQLANVAGTQEPIYGPEACQSVAIQAETTPFTELQRSDLAWAAMETTNVETQCWYLTGDNGYLGMAQIIYNNVGGLRTTVQFNCKIHYPKGDERAPLWSSDPLENHEFSEDKTNLYADNLAIELSEDGTTYTVKSLTNDASIVNLTFTRTSPGFQIGKDGKTYFGTDPAAPWGAMRHTFWPRNKVEGTIVTADGPIDFAGKGFFIHALQGMKPHHAAAQWNFVDFQGPTYSAVMMEYTTPPSYGSTRVNVSGIARDGEVVAASASGSITHTKVKGDPENDWPEPERSKIEWKGKSKDGKEVSAEIEADLDVRLDRIDVMAQVPMFVKRIAGSVAGTKPYIYQYCPRGEKLSLKLKIGDEEILEEGNLYTEATFISEI